jgi:hypothetical protein
VRGGWWASSQACLPGVTSPRSTGRLVWITPSMFAGHDVSCPYKFNDCEFAGDVGRVGVVRGYEENLYTEGWSRASTC